MIAFELFSAAGTILGVLMFLPLLRILLGPTVPDRVVGLDTLNTLVVASMIVFGAAFQQVFFVDVAIVYTILSFVGTLYIAKYLEGGLV